jgi:hypothetical protein
VVRLGSETGDETELPTPSVVLWIDQSVRLVDDRNEILLVARAIAEFDA